MPFLLGRAGGRRTYASHSRPRALRRPTRKTRGSRALLECGRRRRERWTAGRPPGDSTAAWTRGRRRTPRRGPSSTRPRVARRSRRERGLGPARRTGPPIRRRRRRRPPPARRRGPVHGSPLASARPASRPPLRPRSERPPAPRRPRTPMTERGTRSRSAYHSESQTLLKAKE